MTGSHPFEPSSEQATCDHVRQVLAAAGLSNYETGQLLLDLLEDLTGRVHASGEELAYEPAGWLATAQMHLGYALTETDATWWDDPAT